jgi:deoxyribonuclease I
MKTLFSLLPLLFVLLSPVQAADPTDLPNTAGSFSTAKRWLYERVYYDRPVTFYCGCRYNTNTKETDLASCGVTPRKNADRAGRVEAEHVMPAHHFGQSRLCWRQPEKVCGEKMSGRACCEKADPLFIAAHNDLHNLFPAVGEINGDRSNFSWGMIPGAAKDYGACEIKIDSSIRRAEPPNAVKGDIARTYFYMEHTYGFNISRQERQLFTAWAKQDPPDEWEYERNSRIAAIQGRGNPFITIGLTGEEVKDERSAPTAPKPAPVKPAPAPDSGAFSCQPKKTCKAMASCAEAMYHLETCGNKRLDGDGDGVPCEKICGGG